MKRNKIISILECSARNKMLVGVLAVSLIGAGGIFLSNNTAFSNNTIGINKTVLAGTVNNDGNKACVINGNDNLVLYTSAESNSNVESYISVGEMLTINSYSNGYYNITVEETGATGYIASSDMERITSGTSDSLTSLNETAYVTNVSTDVNLREEATMNSTALLKLQNNIEVTVLGKRGEWYKVDINGTVGYIYEEYIAIANTTSNKSSTNTLSNSGTSTTTTNSNVESAKSQSNTPTNSNNTTSSSSVNSTGVTKSNNSLSSQENKIAYIWQVGSADIYKEPSVEATVLNTLQSGTKIILLNTERYGWYKIEYGNDEIGYISDRYISFTKPTNTNSNVTSKQVEMKEYVADTCSMYQEQSNSSNVVNTVNSGSRIFVVSNYSNGWSWIMYDNTKGYIRTNNITSVAPENNNTTNNTGNNPTTKNTSSNNNSSNNKNTTQSNTIEVNKTAYIPLSCAPELLSSPNYDASSLTKLFPGTPVYVETVTNGWAKVQVQGKIGYVKYYDLTYTNPNEN